MSRLSSQLRFNDLTGGINNVYSKEQLNSSTKRTETPDMVNVEYFKLGGIKTMSGNTKIGVSDFSTQKASIIAGWEYTKGDNRYMLIGLDNGEVRVYDESLDKPDLDENCFRLIYKFPTSTNRMSFCNMNNGVVITNGIDDLLFYECDRNIRCEGYISTDGTRHILGEETKFGIDIRVGDGLDINGSTYYVEEIESETSLYVDRDIEDDDEVLSYKAKLADTSLCNAYLTNTDPDVKTGELMHTPIRGLAIQFYNGRLWVGGKNGLFYSPIGEYNNWDIFNDAGVMYDFYNDSSEIKALGLYSEYLMVHREFYTYIITMTGDTTSIAVKPFSNVTCESQQSWIVSNTKYFVYSKEFMDIYPLVQHTIFNDKFLGEPITQKVRNIFKQVPPSRVSEIFCVSRPKERQMLFYLPTVDGSGSNTALIFDFQTKSFLLRKLPNQCNVTCAFNFNNDVYVGTSDGLVLKEFTGRNFTITGATRTVIVEEEGRVEDTQDTKLMWVYYETTEDDGTGNTKQVGHWRVEFEYDGYHYWPDTVSFDVSLGYDINDVLHFIEANRMQMYSTAVEDQGISDVLLVNAVLYGEIEEEDHNPFYFYGSNCIITISKDGIVEREIEVVTTDEVPINAYYKSPWFDWAGNYYQSFSEFFIECDSNYTNNFIIRTQKDGTSRYEDRDILEDKFIDKQNVLVYDDDNKEWDKDKWGKITFDTLRMLLPNSIFESFQVEFKTNPEKLNQGFHIYQYGFRRIETEEAPW